MAHPPLVPSSSYSTGVSTQVCQPRKKQRSWPRALGSPGVGFSKPIFRGSIREDPFENGYREPRSRRISRSLRKCLAVLGKGRLRESPTRKIVVFCSVAIGSPTTAPPPRPDGGQARRLLRGGHRGRL